MSPRACTRGAAASLLAVFLPLALQPVTVAAVPGCGCEVRSCCDSLWSDQFKHPFESTLRSAATVIQDDAWSPACTMLNFIPGIEDQGGLCAPNASVNATLDVCSAMASSGTATSQLTSGKPVVGLVIEPGTCGELTGDMCWTTPANKTWNARWQGMRSPAIPGSTECFGTLSATDPAIAVAMSCPANKTDDGLRVKISWVSAGTNPTFSACDMEADFDEVLVAESWTEPESAEAGPRWACFSVPMGSYGEEPYRALLYSIGDVPCLYEASTTSTSSASLSSMAGFALLFSYMVAAARNIVQ